jgi:YidC/Oxa1 family membrane protein insertase
MQKRFIVFLTLSLLIFVGWNFVVGKFFPQLAPKPQPPASSPAPVSPSPTVAATPTPVQAVGTVPSMPVQQVAEREIKLRTEFWEGTLSNRGAVLNEWTVTKFTDGKIIDKQTGGVHLVTRKISAEVGAPFRLMIPSAPELEKELNSALYAVQAPQPSDATEIFLGKDEQKDFTFTYSNSSGVVAKKTLHFNGAGYDFGLQVDVTRNGVAVETNVVIGPNFGDHSINNYSVYRPAPQASYAIGTSVKRDTHSNVDGSGAKTIPASPVRWGGIDDNYFAMVLVPSNPASAVTLINNRRKETIDGSERESDYLSIALPVASGGINHVYAGPKDLTTLARISEKFGLGDGSGNLEDIISYGWLSFISPILKPIASFMLKSLLFINHFTHNYGWAIVVLTIVLNMFFFPLRWRSSVAMRKTAALQPRMRDIQERMKKLDKSDPRAQELQREQLALMKEGNPLMGCLPLLLQMPFFLAVFTILTVSIEVRHAPFFGWIHDLSAPDPYFILPITMCVSMIVQTALTPSTADPMQKRISYIMPLVFAYFLKSAPAGLVLYWMVSNLVGIAQQFVINRLNPPPATASTPGAQAKVPQAKDSKIPKRKKGKTELASS